VFQREKKPKAKPAKKEAKQARLDFDGEFELPSVDLLARPVANAAVQRINEESLEKNARLLETVLDDFGVKGQIVRIRPGPVVTLYELEPAPGTKTSRVVSLADDVARSMSAVSVRIAVVPGRSVIGIELPNRERETVALRELLEDEGYNSSQAKLALVLGKDIGGQPIVVDLARMPHLLIAGTTGSGKSVAINTMIMSLLYRLTPDQCKFIMIDPKMLELSVYDDIPHLLAPVVTEPKKAIVALKWVVREMENRYRAMSKLGVRNIEGYNQRLEQARNAGEQLTRRVQTGFDPDTGKPIYEEEPFDLSPLPFIVVVVDEMADLMLVAGKDIEAAIQRLAQMARAAGIHIIMATQRPSVDVITGTIKANFPTRVSFHVTTKIDSRTILGETGAEQLLGQGDMLYMANGGRITRIHGPFISDREVETIVKFLKSQGEPAYLQEVTESDEDGLASEEGGLGGGNGGSGDDLYDQAVALVARERKCSTSFIQRYLQIGYNRAARIVERMEKEGVVSQANHVGKREVLAPEGGGRD
jgi:S-DNA-T family DNA segregation ATPase FtsK/SpoIIIE